MPGVTGARIRACMLSFYFHPSYSGSAVQARNLALHLREQGVDATFVSANLSGSPARERVDGMGLSRLRICKTPDFQIPTFWISLAWFLWRHRAEYDLIHAHGTFQHGIASVVGRILGKPTILKVAMAQSDIAFHKHGRLWGRVNRFLVRRFDRYIATSEEVRQEFADRGLDVGRVRLIPNGVATDRFRPPVEPGGRGEARRKLGLRDVPTVCYVGVIDARKNLDGILRIWKSVQERTRTGQLVLVGPRPRGEEEVPGSFHHRLMRYIAENGLQDSVVFAGAQEDVPGWLRAADVFLFPSKREGMPNALLEAMASGLACISSRIGGSVDIIRHDVDGYVFEVDDEEGMATAVQRLLQDSGQAARIGAAARAKATQHFSLTVVAERYSKLYAEMLERR